MPDQSLIVFGGNALATRVTPLWNWTLLLLALMLTGLFICSLIGAMVWWLCCRARNKNQEMKRTMQKGSSSAYSGILPMSRYPKNGPELATFVTRRDNVWRERQLAGRDCFLMLD